MDREIRSGSLLVPPKEENMPLNTADLAAIRKIVREEQAAERERIAAALQGELVRPVDYESPGVKDYAAGTVGWTRDLSLRYLSEVTFERADKILRAIGELSPGQEPDPT